MTDPRSGIDHLAVTALGEPTTGDPPHEAEQPTAGGLDLVPTEGRADGDQAAPQTEPPADASVPLAQETPAPSEDAAELLFSMLSEAVDRHASDLMLTPGEPPLLRIDSQWARLSDTVLDEATMTALLRHTADLAQVPAEGVEGGFDAAIEAPGNTRFRVNVFRHRGRPAAVLRVIPQALKSLEELGLPSTVKQFAAYRQGLVLVTGATGHGKTTTLASLIDVINSTYNHHIITLEDPIEFVHSNKRSVIHQREVGRDTPSFAEGLRAALRQSPDVILVGELRDLETISAALTAAETGHLVLGTLHTNGALDTINRIIDVFPGVQQEQIRTQVAASLSAVVSQVLVPQVGGGRVLAYELMIVTTAIRNLIRENKAHQIITAMQTGKENGMTTLERVLVELHNADRITYEQGLQAARNRDTFESMVKMGR